MLEHVAEDVGSPEEFQHLRVGFARSLFEAAGPVLAERLRSAAPVAPHHARAMDDVRTAAGQVAAAALARAVFDAVAAGMPGAAAKAAESLVRSHAAAVVATRVAQSVTPVVARVAATRGATRIRRGAA